MEAVDGNITSRYLRGIDLIAQQIGNSLFYYLFNVRGDIVQQVDGNGNSTHMYEYDAFGNERNPNPNDPNPFRYCGEYWDSEIQSYYLRARYMNPTIGRFSQEDPYWHIGNMIFDNCIGGVPSITAIMQSINLYVYAINNPITWVDPSGLEIELRGGTAEQRQEYERAIAHLKQSPTFRYIWQKVYDANVFTIVFHNDLRSEYNPRTKTIYWDPTGGIQVWGGTFSAAMALAHEMGHAAQHLEGGFDAYLAIPKRNINQRDRERARIEADNLARFETPIAQELGETTRGRPTHGVERRMNNSTHFIITARTWLGVIISTVHHNRFPILGTTIGPA